MGSGGGPASARREYSDGNSASPGFPGGGGAGDALDRLSAAACGCLLTLALGSGKCDDGRSEDSALAALVEPDATACRAGLAALGVLDRAERARAIARLLRRARAPVPDGIEHVHPGWLRAALEGEPTPILRAIADGLPPEVRAVAREVVFARGDDGMAEVAPPIAEAPLAELRRAAFASLVSMPSAADAERADGPAWLRSAVLPLAALLTEIERLGAATLGISLAGAPPAVVARAAAAGGNALASVVLEAARRTAPVEERDRARALVVAASRVSEIDVGSTTIVGLLALAEELAAAPGAAQVIAQRLPPRLGRILLYPSGPAHSQ